MKYLLLLPVALLLIALAALNAAVPASILWEWFIVPLNFPEIGVAHAAGIMLTISVFLIKGSKDNFSDSSGAEVIGYFGGLLLSPWVLLALGWLFV